ncbi:hypothetical protein LTR10_009591 [Elasticomyces elasticus]|nr:hypothetical protein LTR10_009591 [Elasticomyces elasticus]KAK4971314.1 hypothetical protein LTR42_007040 [Elasticomyces elasticus]
MTLHLPAHGVAALLLNDDGSEPSSFNGSCAMYYQCSPCYKRLQSSAKLTFLYLKEIRVASDTPLVTVASPWCALSKAEGSKIDLHLGDTYRVINHLSRSKAKRTSSWAGVQDTQVGLQH